MLPIDRYPQSHHYHHHPVLGHHPKQLPHWRLEWRSFLPRSSRKELPCRLRFTFQPGKNNNPQYDSCGWFECRTISRQHDVALTAVFWVSFFYVVYVLFVFLTQSLCSGTRATKTPVNNPEQSPLRHRVWRLEIARLVSSTGANLAKPTKRVIAPSIVNFNGRTGCPKCVLLVHPWVPSVNVPSLHW